MHTEFKCTKCREVLQEYELLADDLCPYCYCTDLFERETEGRDDRGYHTNEFGEVIPDLIDVTPVEVA